MLDLLGTLACLLPLIKRSIYWHSQHSLHFEKLCLYYIKQADDDLFLWVSLSFKRFSFFFLNISSRRMSMKHALGVGRCDGDY